jgi:hypothetical protein
MTGQQNYTPGEIIKYTSFGPSGYSRAEVIRYASPEEQWQICPNCDQQAVPGAALRPDERIAEFGRPLALAAGNGLDLLRRCPRCGAFVRWPDLPPLLYVRTVTPPRCSPFLVRETQTRRPREQEATSA